MPFTDSIVVKATCGDVIRRAPLNNSSPTYNELCFVVQRMFRSSGSASFSSVDNVLLKYKDEDGDWVLMDTDDDVAHALTQSSTLRLQVSDKERGAQSAPVSTAPAPSLEQTAMIQTLNDLRERVDALTQLLAKAQAARDARQISADDLTRFLDKDSTPAKPVSTPVAAPVGPVGLGVAATPPPAQQQQQQPQQPAKSTSAPQQAPQQQAYPPAQYMTSPPPQPQPQPQQPMYSHQPPPPQQPQQGYAPAYPAPPAPGQQQQQQQQQYQPVQQHSTGYAPQGYAPGYYAAHPSSPHPSTQPPQQPQQQQQPHQAPQQAYATQRASYAGYPASYAPPGYPADTSMQTPRTSVPGLYSSTGFDMIGVLARVATRPHPQVSVGPVDMSCSFAVSDARKPDTPIVYVSETFERLTGYTSSECVGRNCRFLQSPDGYVTSGSYRRYTDNATVYSLKQSLHFKRECQYTLINYRKGGEPFINLITVIPISWERDDEITYFVGFQVDLVEQPNAIMSKMKEGTYVVNYQISDAPVHVPRAIKDTPGDFGADMFMSDDAQGLGLVTGTARTAVSTGNTGNSSFGIDLAELMGVSDPTEAAGLFYHSLVEQVDFVHVLSLRGVLLYVSPDCRRLLEYTEDELVGHSLSEFCHPGDLVSVMRELKDSSTGSSTVNIVYRIRRKHSGYVWIEVSGKCALGEKSKGKKFVVLTGREKPVARLHKLDVAHTGGITESDVWSKLSMEGLYLYTSPECYGLLSFTPSEVVGKSMFDFVYTEDQNELNRALMLVQSGKIATWRHRIKNKRGEFVVVQSSFFPGNSNSPLDIRFVLHKCSEPPATSTAGATAASPSTSSGPQQSPVEGGGQDAGSGTVQVLSPTPITDDNDDLFDVLSSVRCTSWQYELHQLRMQNRRLRSEIESVAESTRPKKKGRSKQTAADLARCDGCGRTDSLEWRRVGDKLYCNMCTSLMLPAASR
ncbi:hypothetical protein RI367_004930 [Sorochytrium milnesiophthora]